MVENKLALIRRFWIYQKERFPFLGHGILIASFNFSTIAFFLQINNSNTFIPLEHFLVAVLSAISFFFIMRVADEFKDAKDDALYRSELPVPRGLISLKELFYIALAFILVQILAHLFIVPTLLKYLIIPYAYLFLMTKEFFVKEWLRKNQFFYVISHMLIMPIFDFYISSFAWEFSSFKVNNILAYFLVLSFVNGLILEIGRKIKRRQEEKPGVVSYSSLLGYKGALLLWLFLIILSSFLGIYLAQFCYNSELVFMAFIFGSIFSAIVFFIYLFFSEKLNPKLLELFSVLWVIFSYLILGLGFFTK